MPDPQLLITCWSALILAALYLILTWRVIRHRRRDGVVHGDNDDHILRKKIRGHANAGEQIPIGLIMIGLNEWIWGSTLWVAIPALLLVCGRISHGTYFTQHGLSHQLRVYGMLATLIAQAMSIALLALGLLS